MESKRAQSKLYKDKQRRFTNQSTTVISLHSSCLKNWAQFKLHPLRKIEEIDHALQQSAIALLTRSNLAQKSCFLMNFSLELQSVAHHEVLDHPGNCLRFIYCANSGKLQFSNNFSRTF